MELPTLAQMDIPTPVIQGFAAFGILYLLVKVFSFIRLLFSLFIVPGIDLSEFAPKTGIEGSWAVVTGASDGIGKEYCNQLAARGFNIFLVSRTASKLEALAQELLTKYGVKTNYLAMDFSKNFDADYKQLKTLLQNLDISILINNVGQSHSIPVPFIETPQKEMVDIVTINCLGTLKVTQIVAPGMVERKHGLILTMASFGGILPVPLLATYSGSKAFLQQWSTALSAELKPSNVHVQLVQSYLVTSAMSKIRKPSLFVATPKTFVRAALGSIGRSGGAQGIAATSSPYWSHGILHWVFATFLNPLGSTLLSMNKKSHEAIRKRALRKAERDGKKTS